MSAGGLGRAYFAQLEGILASYLNQPIEVPELRPRLHDTTGIGGLVQLSLVVVASRSVKGAVW